MNKKIIFIILLIIIALCGVIYWIYRESAFSGQILSLNISGPATATVGDEITYNVKYKNTGNFVLQKPELIFNMPDNSMTEDGKTRVAQNLKNMYPGDEETVQIKTRLLGKEGDVKSAKASITYTPQNLTAQYESDASFNTTLNPVPINLTFDLPAKIEKGKTFQYSINYSSDIDYPLENLSLKIDPTPGFDFSSAVPASLDHSEWKLPTLNKSQNGKITMSGSISADINQNLTFSGTIGMWQNGNFIIIKQATANAEVIQPLMVITQKINGSGSYTASPGETLNYQIFFRNISPDPFINLSATAKLDNSVLDMSTVQVGNGQLKNGNTIVWNYGQNPSLLFVGPQQQGELDFSVKVKTPLAATTTATFDEINIAQITQKFSVNVNPGTGASAPKQ